jgi:hypothetical protein
VRLVDLNNGPGRARPKIEEYGDPSVLVHAEPAHPFPASSLVEVDSRHVILRHIKHRM